VEAEGRVSIIVSEYFCLRFCFLRTCNRIDEKLKMDYVGCTHLPDQFHQIDISGCQHLSYHSPNGWTRESKSYGSNEFQPDWAVNELFVEFHSSNIQQENVDHVVSEIQSYLSQSKDNNIQIECKGWDAHKAEFRIYVLDSILLVEILACGFRLSESTSFRFY